jgi:hypothetical protein
LVEAADRVRERFGTRAITRARLLRTGLPAPFERDHGTATERRGAHAADIEAERQQAPRRGGGRGAAVGDRRRAAREGFDPQDTREGLDEPGASGDVRDTQGGTDLDEASFDEA